VLIVAALVVLAVVLPNFPTDFDASPPRPSKSAAEVGSN
jgi:hypothetical protein